MKVGRQFLGRSWMILFYGEGWIGGWGEIKIKSPNKEGHGTHRSSFIYFLNFKIMQNKSNS